LIAEYSTTAMRLCFRHASSSLFSAPLRFALITRAFPGHFEYSPGSPDLCQRLRANKQRSLAGNEIFRVVGSYTRSFSSLLSARFNGCFFSFVLVFIEPVKLVNKPDSLYGGGHYVFVTDLDKVVSVLLLGFS
jgi:hypothetical protein